MNKRKMDNKTGTPMEKAYGDFAGSSVPAAPDGGIAPGAGQMLPYEAYDEEQFICLQGPCRHLWEIEVAAGAGNAEGTFEALGIREPRQHAMSCIVHLGLETDLSRDEPVFECNRWDPILRAERIALEYRRRRFFEEQAKEEMDADAEEEPITE